MNTELLFYAGYLSLIAFMSGDVIGGLSTPKYSYISNSVSELIQSGSAYRLKLSPFFTLNGIMNALFSLGIMLVKRD